MKHDEVDAFLKEMNDCLRHRGPDMEGYWADPQAGLTLAFSRLANPTIKLIANMEGIN